MVCTVCRIIKKGCTDNCCFEKYFRPQDKEKFLKIRENNYSVEFMRAKLSDDDLSDEHKKGLIQKWYDCFNVKGKEKKAKASSSNSEKKELQASKSQASSSNELGCKETSFWAALFSPESKNKIVEIINEQGMEMVKTAVKLMLEKLSRKTDAEEKLAAQILLDLNQEDQQ